MSEKFSEALKFLNASNLSPQYFGISQSLFSKKIKGVDSKKGFDIDELKNVAIGLRQFIILLDEAATELEKQAEDKTLLINTLKDES